MANVALMLSMPTLLGCATKCSSLCRRDLKESVPRVRACCSRQEERLDGSKVRYLTDGTRMPASLPGSWHQTLAPDAQSNCLHIQIYDCMINEDFILPSATLQSAFTINKGPPRRRRLISDFNLVPPCWIHLSLNSRDWHEPESDCPLMDLLFLSSCLDQRFI